MSNTKRASKPGFGAPPSKYEELTRGRLGKSSGTFVKTSLEWKEEDDRAFRREVEARFRERTPPVFTVHKDEISRVSREEMESWAIQVLRKPLPQTEEWAIDFIIWYQKMAKANAVHMRWLDCALCGAHAHSRLDPITSDVESEITCATCIDIFRGPSSKN